MTTNSSPTIFEAYSPANVRSASFHHHQARVHPQPSFRSTPPISSPICRQAQLISNATKFAKIGNQSRLHSHNSCESSPRLVERCVVVAKQQDGYGLLVTGEHPVYVESVKPEGAAARAGVRQGDQIVKINGMPVSSSNHYEVLRMISGWLSCLCVYYFDSAGPNVCLTLLGEPLSCKTCRPIFFDSAFFEESRTKKSSGELPHHADSEHEILEPPQRQTVPLVELTVNLERL
ncbi:PDZ domain-containing protein [Aphelenchoides besseyi]|nr:PDZ domain-containing protein [Aphelenchoides besseyi]